MFQMVLTWMRGVKLPLLRRGTSMKQHEQQDDEAIALANSGRGSLWIRYEADRIMHMPDDVFNYHVHRELSR